MPDNWKATLVAAALLTNATAFAQQPTNETSTGSPLADCMLAHVDAPFEQQMKTMMIDALKDDTESLNRSMMAMGVGVLSIAQQHCGVKMSDLQTPEFERAAGLFGQTIGERIMTKAMAKIGQ